MLKATCVNVTFGDMIWNQNKLLTLQIALWQKCTDLPISTKLKEENSKYCLLKYCRILSNGQFALNKSLKSNVPVVSETPVNL